MALNPEFAVLRTHDSVAPSSCHSTLPPRGSPETTTMTAASASAGPSAHAACRRAGAAWTSAVTKHSAAPTEPVCRVRLEGRCLEHVGLPTPLTRSALVHHIFGACQRECPLLARRCHELHGRRIQSDLAGEKRRAASHDRLRVRTNVGGCLPRRIRSANCCLLCAGEGAAHPVR